MTPKPKAEETLKECTDCKHYNEEYVPAQGCLLKHRSVLAQNFKPCDEFIDTHTPASDGGGERPKVVVLCGSSKFVEIMAVCQWLIEKQENAIGMGLHLLPYWYATKERIPDHLAEHEGVAEQMDELHLRKIDLADEIFVVNYGAYIGESTSREIEYTKKHDKPIRLYTDDAIGKQVDELISKVDPGEV